MKPWYGFSRFSAPFALFAHRPDADDCHYINLSVGAVDNADQPLLKWDTMHGIPELPIVLPTYRVHSIELMMAALSRTTGIDAINLFHFLLPAAGAVCCCLAWAKLLRTTLPTTWLWVFIGVMFIYLFMGGPHRWYGNFALVRLHRASPCWLPHASLC